MSKKEEWRRRLQYFDLLNNHLNYVKVVETNSYEHELAKFNEVYKCRKLGHHTLTEARMKGDVGRPDFVCLDCPRIKELLKSEKELNLEKKRLVYPKEFDLEWEKV